MVTRSVLHGHARPAALPMASWPRVRFTRAALLSVVLMINASADAYPRVVQREMDRALASSGMGRRMMWVVGSPRRAS